jgi:2Fe-2S ferredoxin
MVQVTFVRHDGDSQTISVRGGLSLMEAAVQNGIEDIEGECGGACSCATCHVYVDPAWTERVGPPNKMEAEMLEMVEELRPTSRLSCQIKIVEALDGLIVETPAQQQSI